MKTRFSEGFTILETSLFLALTGVLIVTLMVGVTLSLNVQRYKDATTSFQSLVQSQYGELSSTQNTRGANWNCGTTAKPSTGGDTLAGQTDCLLVGRYMRIDGGDVAVYSVVAYKFRTLTYTSETLELRGNYRYNVSSEGVLERKLEWGAYISWPRSGSGSRPVGTPRQMGILFLRSPVSGQVFTYTSDAVPARSAISNSTFQSLIMEGDTIPGQSGRTICINPDGLVSQGQSNAVIIAPYAATPSAITLRSNDDPGRSNTC